MRGTHTCSIPSCSGCTGTRPSTGPWPAWARRTVRCCRTGPVWWRPRRVHRQRNRSLAPCRHITRTRWTRVARGCIIWRGRGGKEPCDRCDVRRRWRRDVEATRPRDDETTTTTSTTNGVRVCARDDVHNMCIRRRRRPAGVAYVRRRPCRRRGAYMPPPMGGTKGFSRWGRPPPHRRLRTPPSQAARSMIFHLFLLLLYNIILLSCYSIYYLYLFLHRLYVIL